MSWQTEANERLDNAAVDTFSSMMKDKLRRAREKGRSGWNDPEACSAEHLADLLLNHVLDKGNAGNFVDIANLAMMLQCNGAAPDALLEAMKRRLIKASD